jgi:DNA-directed RNA polymerase specialized sigma24 family protein
MDDVTEAPIEDLVPPAAGHLSYEQVFAAVDALSDLDRVRLDRLERRHLDGTDFAEGDLLQEAVCSAIFEDKKCPRTTPFVAFLAQSMRNIAGRRRKRLRRQVPIAGGATQDEADDEFDIEDDTPNAEEQIIRSEDEKRATKVWAVLEPLYVVDEQVSLVLLGWEEDMRGKELREFAGVTQDRLDYIIKKIRRIAAKHYPKGWRL